MPGRRCRNGTKERKSESNQEVLWMNFEPDRQMELEIE